MILVFKIVTTIFFVTVAAYTLIAAGRYLFGKQAGDCCLIDDDWDIFIGLFIGLWVISIGLMLIALTL